VLNYSAFRKGNHKRESTASCERAGIVDVILAASFAVRQSKTILARYSDPEKAIVFGKATSKARTPILSR
jgi:hypothetical protein